MSEGADSHSESPRGSNGAWKRQGTTVDNLTKELRLALQYPEGAAG